MVLNIVVPYSVSTSNHNSWTMFVLANRLFLILFLHQTTTFTTAFKCLLLLFLILFLHQTTTTEPPKGARSVLFLILFLHQTTTLGRCSCSRTGCSLFCFYIKPQLLSGIVIFRSVVPYSVSTSNHNLRCYGLWAWIVVPYSVSTSNHNLSLCFSCLYSVVPYSVSTSNHNYSKEGEYETEVVPYSVSTSNHNFSVRCGNRARLFLILFLHQTTTFGRCSCSRTGCSLFCFYIKPQLVFSSA